MPLLSDRDADWPGEVFIQISESQVGRAIRSRRWKYAAAAPGKDGWDDSSSDVYVEAALYDLLADPHELHNRAGCASHRMVADVLRSRLIRRMIDAGEHEPIIEPAPLIECAGQLSVELEEGWL